jgi:hypothetical protein
MRHRATPRFWACYNALPSEVRQLADRCYAGRRQARRHPSLHFKIEVLMNRHQTFAVLFTPWPFFLLGCGDTQDNRNANFAPKTRSEPVLKVDDDAKSVISKVLKTHAGEKAFSRWSCGYLKYKTKGGVVPAEFGEVIVEDTFQLPGHFKRVTRMVVRGNELRTTYVVNHGKGWTKKGNSPAEPIENNFTEKTEHPFAGYSNLAFLTEADVQLTKLRTGKIAGKQTIGIRARSELGEVDCYFGSQTGVLLKFRKSVPGPDPDTPSVMETFLDDYKDVQGTQVPMRIKVAQDGSPILDVTLIDVRFANKFKESVFAKPVE